MVSITITNWPDIKGIETTYFGFINCLQQITNWPDIKGIETAKLH